MILVTIGTERYPFDRLLQMVESVSIELGEDNNIVFQTGHCKFIPKIGRSQKFFNFEEIKELMKESKIVITHAGVGSTLLSLSIGKKPIIVPRLAKYGEAIDDHQVIYAERMFKEGYAFLAKNLIELKEVMNTILQNPVLIVFHGDNRRKEDLIKYLENVIKGE